ncbi:MAG: hypothetical protein CL878_08720 [Dehalococcoidia bacterium]|nr:hypothetical protein [Dehalococcoidia bacterium]
MSTEHSEIGAVGGLARILDAAADGDFPPSDGLIEVIQPKEARGLEAVVEFTGHAVVVTSLPEAEIFTRQIDAFGGIVAPDFLRWLAGPLGRIGAHDAVLVRRGVGDGRLPQRLDLDDHPRVRLARRLRTDVQVYGDERGLVTLGRGLANRWEISTELADRAPRRRGLGRSLIREGVRLVPARTPVFASVSPGNAASLRAFLAAGFRPIGAEVIVSPER